MSTPAANSELVALVDIEVEPVRLSLLYRAGLALAATTMLVLPIVYVALVLAVAWGVWIHATTNYGIVTESGGTQARVLAYVAPIVAGSLGVLFMIKPLFAPARGRPAAQSLRREDHPVLHAYVDRLCDSLGAPRPQRIDVDMQVNASASFRRGFGSFLGSDLVLTLGLPLTAGMTLGQWTGVLAHEFGHFTQGWAMRFSYVIGSVNHWFARVVYERDAWDARLEKWTQESSTGWGWAVMAIAKAFIWVSRRILQLLMMAGLAVSSFLSRQMEFDADLYQARVSGSDLFKATHLRLPIISVAWERTTSYLGHMWDERRLVDDAVGLHVTEADRVAGNPDFVSQIVSGTLAAPTHHLSTHPSTADRIAAIEGRALEGKVLSDAPATAVFTDFDALARQVSADFYAAQLGPAFDARLLVPLENVIEEQQGHIERADARDDFFLGTDLCATGVFPRETADGDPTGRLTTARQRQAASATEAAALLRSFDELAHHRRVVGLLVRAGSANLPIAPADLGLEVGPDFDAEARYRELTVEYHKGLAALKPHLEVTADRMGAAIELARTPSVQSRLTRSTATVERLDAILAVIRAIEPYWPAWRGIGSALFDLGFLWNQVGERVEPGPTLDTMQSLWGDLHRHVGALNGALSGLVYPFDHGDGAKDAADFVFGEIPAPGPPLEQVAGAGSDRLGLVYFRSWAELSGMALEIEEMLGLEPLPKVPPPEPPTDAEV